MNALETEAAQIARNLYDTMEGQLKSAVKFLDKRGIEGVNYVIGAIQHVGKLIESCSEKVRETSGWKDVSRLYRSYSTSLVCRISGLRRDFPAELR